MAIGDLTRAIREASQARTSEFEWFKAHLSFATKHDLEQMERRIMSAISDYTDRVNTVFDQVGTSVDQINDSLAGVATDIGSLKNMITQLQNNPGPITPEDQALLDQSEAKLNGVASRLDAVKQGLASVDALTENPPVPPAEGRAAR